jgi:PilZ domain-containing protein
MPIETKKVIPPVRPVAAERRTEPRHKFLASAEIINAQSGARTEANVGDIGPRGCFVETDRPLATGTAVTVRISKDGKTFEAECRVAYSMPRKGMGLVFTTVELDQHRVLAAWIEDSVESAWLASNRRRSQRILVEVPVRVSGRNSHGSPFEEDTQTLAISAHGALLNLATQVNKGDRVTLFNARTESTAECAIAYVTGLQKDRQQVGVQFVLPYPAFWHVAFPPEDWTRQHPDSKSRTGGR